MRRSICILGLVAVSALAGCRHQAVLDGHELTATSHMVATCEEAADGTKKWTIDTTKTTIWDSVKAGGRRVLNAFAGIVGKAGVAVD